jgi:hypothetical protein
VCNAMAPECTVPIRTGRRATARLARNIPRAVVAISKEGWRRVTNGKRLQLRGVPTEPTTKKPRHGVAPGLGTWVSVLAFEDANGVQFIKDLALLAVASSQQ